ncbi:hypothetical protein [Kingella kingae]|uniref:hypothetical protein n=1 Tax=Kingella kingae TaxID=504 RepID=UPI0025504B5D|nr:hypothetical protein [Kingella kingae]MDK4541590.1 hypothetical protein [Kingella kingae]
MASQPLLVGQQQVMVFWHWIWITTARLISGKEIFGNHSVLSNGATAAHGYA